jgi:DNA-binding MarR family transcriptional regulator
MAGDTRRGGSKRPRESAARKGALPLHDYQLLAEFRFVLARFLDFSEQAAKAEGLAPRQHQALLAIKGFPDGAAVTVGDLAARLCIRHHSAVGLVDRLAASGHIERRAHPADRRRINLALTGKGEKVLATLSAVHRRQLRRIMPVLKPLLTRL